MASSITKPRNEFKANEPMDAGRTDHGKNEPMDKIKEAGAQAVGKAREAAESVGEMASHAACAATKKADDLTAAAGHEVRDAANALRQKGPHEGMAGRASAAVADALQGGGRYLEEAKLTGAASDLTEVIRTHPIPTMLICLGLGYCVGRALRD